MQLIAGRTAQEYNRRKARKGAYWADRYHATAVDTEGYLARCLVYIDMNMVRAGVVSHPGEWADGGYAELMVAPKRYAIVDVPVLLGLLELTTVARLQAARARWVASDLQAERRERVEAWTGSLAVGSAAFVQAVRAGLGIGARHRDVVATDEGHSLRERAAAYTVDFTQ
jgi:putative transposase